MQCQGYGEMVGFPTYSYTRMSEENQQNLADPNNLATSERLPKETYDYYHRLFRLTRTELPVEKIKEIGTSAEYRENLELIDAFLSEWKFSKFSAGPASIAPTSDMSAAEEDIANASMTPSARTNQSVPASS